MKTTTLSSKKLSRKELRYVTGYGAAIVGGGSGGGTNNGGGSGNIVCYRTNPTKPCPEEEGPQA